MSIAVRTATGAAWQLGAGLGVRAAGIVGAVILTRFLTPAAYGEVMLAAACVIFAMRTVATGPSSYVIACRTSGSDTFQALVLQLLMSTLSLILLVSFREPIASALGAPGMAGYVPGLAVAGLISQISAVPAATLTRSLRFDVTAVAKIVGETAYTLTAVGLVAILGPSAIVAGSLVRAGLTAALVMLRSDRSQWLAPSRLRWAAIRRQLAFSLPLTGSGLAETVSNYGDNMLVARLYGPGVMGLYSLSFNVASTPSAYVAEYASEALLPGLAAVNDPDKRRSAFLRALAVLPLLVFPLAFGLAVTAPTIVSTLLDQRWAAAGSMISILSGIAVARTIGTVTFPYLLSNRRSSTVFALAVVRATALVVLLLTLGRLGPLHACAAATLSAVAAHLGSVLVVSRSDRIGVISMLGSIAPTLLASTLMVFAVMALRSVLGGGLSMSWMLPAEIAVGALAYVGAALVLAPRQVADLLAVLRSVVVRRSATGEPA